MRTKKATAPERFEELQTMSVRSFTSRDLQEMMGISNRKQMRSSTSEHHRIKYE